jgi:hypothetical protein
MILNAKLIAEGWIDLRASKLTKQERALGDWANEALREAIYHDADYAFEIIEAIHELDPDQKFVEEFAAGPVENLCAYQGVVLIDRIEQKARADKAFAFVLGGVWQNAMPDNIWERVQACRERKGWDGVSA